MALVREGPTDNRFLSELLPRVVEDLCQHYATEVVDLPVTPGKMAVWARLRCR